MTKSITNFVALWEKPLTICNCCNHLPLTYHKTFTTEITISQSDLISDLGYGWSPAMADSAEKLKQIEDGQRDLTDYKSFWIGGSSNAPGTARASIDYSQYLADRSGKPLEI